MRLYDLVVIMRPSAPEKDREKVLETIKGWLKDVKILKEESWGQKPLAYKIKKEIAGVYHLLQLEAESIPTNVEKRILSNNTVIRHLLVRRK